MSTKAFHRTTCRLCGSKNLDLALAYKPTALCDAYVPKPIPQEVYPLDVFLCRDCGFAQVCEIVQAEEIYVDYIYETVSSLGLVEHFQQYADLVVSKLNPPKSSLVVDIGSNDGTLLKLFKARGLRVLGVDPAREIARNATAAGVETWAEFFTAAIALKIVKTHGPATIVTANNIFANVDELGEMTDNIRSLLTSDGVFIFETFYTADFMQNMVFDFIYHEHISLFSVKPLINFFRLHGMELIDAERIPTKGGSLRYTAQLSGGPRKVTPAIAELVDHENKIGLQELDTFKVFGAKIDAAKKELHTLLDDLRRQGKKVDGFGASATTTTFLYHLELGNELGCIYDDYKAKQHLFTPGLHLPVLPPDEIYQRKPDYILIIAWRYYQPIMKKHKAFSDQGGKFIVPFPKLQVL